MSYEKCDFCSDGRCISINECTHECMDCGVKFDVDESGEICKASTEETRKYKVYEFKTRDEAIDFHVSNECSHSQIVRFAHKHLMIVI